MKHLFLTKRILDAANQYGPKFNRISSVIYAAADSLGCPRDHPAVKFAMAYSVHETRMLMDNQKPLPLGVWLKRSLKECYYNNSLTSRSQ